MSLVTPNFDEIQDEVAPGVYKCTVKKAEKKAWPNGGEYINWQLETYGESEPKNNGRAVWHKTALSGRGAFVLQKFYRAATGEMLTGAFDTEQLLGKRVEVEVVAGVNRTTGEASGYNEVKSVKAVQG